MVLGRPVEGGLAVAVGPVHRGAGGEHHHLRLDAFRREKKVPGELSMTMDQTFAEVCPAGGRTMEEQGAQKVAIQGVDDKRGITVVLTTAKGGDEGGTMLPVQGLSRGSKHMLCRIPNSGKSGGS